MRDEELRARLVAYAAVGGQPRRPDPNPAEQRRRGYRALAAATTVAVLLIVLVGSGVAVLVGRWDTGVTGQPRPPALTSRPPASATSTPGTVTPSTRGTATSGTAPSSSTPALSGRLTPGSAVTPTGMGPIRFGMTVQQAERAGSVRLVGLGDHFGNCSYVVPRGWKMRVGNTVVDPVAFMVISGRIFRVDVQSGSTPTSAGIRIGSTEPQIRQAYPGRVAVSHNIYGTRQLTVVPAEAGYRIVFASDGKKVMYFRAGRLREVNAQEGCA
jgi:hypothetical protein